MSEMVVEEGKDLDVEAIRYKNGAVHFYQREENGKLRHIKRDSDTYLRAWGLDPDAYETHKAEPHSAETIAEPELFEEVYPEPGIPYQRRPKTFSEKVMEFPSKVHISTQDRVYEFRESLERSPKKKKWLYGAIGAAALVGAFWLGTKYGGGDIDLDGINQAHGGLADQHGNLIDQHADISSQLSEQQTTINKLVDQNNDLFNQNQALMEQHEDLSRQIESYNDGMSDLRTDTAINRLDSHTIYAVNKKQFVTGGLELIERQGFEVSGVTPAKIERLSEQIKNWNIVVGMKAPGVQNVVDMQQNLGSDGLFSNHGASKAVAFDSPEQLQRFARMAQDVGITIKKT